VHRIAAILALAGAALTLGVAGCGSDDEESPTPDVDQVEIAATALADARRALGDARAGLAGEPSAADLQAAATALRRSTQLVRAAEAGVDAAMLAADDPESVSVALSEADRFAALAVEEALAANEAVLDTAERLGLPPDQLIDPRTDEALELASERVNEASTEVAAARATADS
jgi:hypothetical protein